jgi:hypothetical protein
LIGPWLAQVALAFAFISAHPPDGIIRVKGTATGHLFEQILIAKVLSTLAGFAL